MDMSGEYRIPAPRARVWDALNDPEILKQAIPGCEELIQHSASEMEAKVTAKVGPVKAKFAGRVTLENINAPESYTIVGEGKGGAAGFAKGSADVTLAEEGGETVLNYTAKADVGGKLAQIGSRLVQGAAKKTADDFFARFSELAAAGTSVAGEPVAAEAPAVAAVPDDVPVAEPDAPETAAEAPRASAATVAGAGAPRTAPPDPAPEDTTTAPPRAAPAGGRAPNQMMIWVGAVIAILVILFLFSGG